MAQMPNMLTPKDETVRDHTKNSRILSIIP